MAQIVPGTNWAEQLGTGLGSGISSGLQQLAENKIRQMNEQKAIQQTAQGLRHFPGLNLTSDQAHEIAYLAQTNPTLFNSLISQQQKQLEKESERAASEKLFGKDIAALSPAERKEYVKSSLKPIGIGEALQSWWTGTPTRFQGLGQQGSQPNIQNQTNINPQQTPEPYFESSAGNLLGQLVSKGAQGLGEGITGTAALPFNAANFISGGRIPVPEAIQNLQQLPKNIVEGITENAFQPKTSTEEALGNTVSDIAAILSPSGALGAIGKGAGLLGKSSPWINAAAKFLKVTPKAAAQIAGGGNAAQWLTKQLGAREGVQQAAKLGTMLAIPIAGTRLAGQKVAEIGKVIGQSIPENLNATSQSLFQNTGKLYNALQKTAQSPERDALISELSEMSTAKFPVKKLWDFKQTLDTAVKNPAFEKTVAKVYPEISKEINNTLLKASKEVPSLKELIPDYNDLASALGETSKIQEFVGKHILRRSANPVVQLLFGVGGVTRPKLVIPGTIAAMTLGEAERIGRMALKSPTFRKTYEDISKAALLGNSKAMNDAAVKLNKIYEHESKK